MSNESYKIPKLIFQTFESSNFSNEFQNIINTWKIKNPDYKYTFHDKNDRVNFLTSNFAPNVINAYNRIIPGAYKADLWRYCVLYIYGGVYADIDTLCLGSIDSFLNNDIELMAPIDLNTTPSDGPHNVANGFIAVVPKSPIMLDCINQVIHNVENNIVPVSKINFSGPGILGRSINKYLHLPETESIVGKEGIINNIHLLRFEPITEYIMDKNRNILFQNKNGNSEINKLYELEMRKNNVTLWTLEPRVLH